MTEQRPPRVFISYSNGTGEHQKRVLSLADRLRADGIDAEIDHYNAAPRERWPLWCERQIDAADVVLMVCTETYHRRISGDEEQGGVLRKRSDRREATLNLRWRQDDDAKLGNAK